MSETEAGRGTDHFRMGRHARMMLTGMLLAAAWILWSGYLKALLIGLGMFSCLLVVYLSNRLQLFDKDVFAIRLSLRLFHYWAWLAGQVFRSSLEVARVVLSPRLPVSPTVVEIDSISDHPVDRAILGNSIILTPGTVTLNIDGQRLTVHALTREGADELIAGEMNRRVAALRTR